jgi:hypothetical protein
MPGTLWKAFALPSPNSSLGARIVSPDIHPDFILLSQNLIMLAMARN